MVQASIPASNEERAVIYEALAMEAERVADASDPGSAERLKQSALAWRALAVRARQQTSQ